MKLSLFQLVLDKMVFRWDVTLSSLLDEFTIRQNVDACYRLLTYKTTDPPFSWPLKWAIMIILTRETWVHYHVFWCKIATTSQIGLPKFIIEAWNGVVKHLEAWNGLVKQVSVLDGMPESMKMTRFSWFLTS